MTPAQVEGTVSLHGFCLECKVKLLVSVCGLTPGSWPLFCGPGTSVGTRIVTAMSLGRRQGSREPSVASYTLT